MREVTTQRLSDAVALHTCYAPQFKTMRVSVNLLLPLERATAARNGILPSLVSRATREYPTYTALSQRLAELYGASLSNTVRKVGDTQILTLAASGLSDRYAFGGEDMLAQLTGLLFSVLFDPLKDDEGLFPQDGFLQERRQLLELLDSEFNDKVLYAQRRCEELLFQGQRAGIGRYGSKEDVAALDRGAVSRGWEELLRAARIEIFALGDCQPDPEIFARPFAGLGAPRDANPLPYAEPGEVRRLTEDQPLAQSKLTMAWRANYGPEEKLLFQLMAAVLGGTPSSKLFQNVREKLGLCYYCSAAMAANSRALYVSSGVETENLGRAEEAVNAQLEALRRGELTDEELLAAKLAMENSLRSSADSLGAIEGACLGQLFGGGMYSPEASIRRLERYTREQVIEAACRLRPAAVYILKGGAAVGAED